MQRFIENKNNKQNLAENVKYVSIPYIQGLSEKLNKIVKPHNIKLAYKNTNNLNYLYTKLKDKIPLKKQTHVVYKIPCGGCNGIYIGQTQQHLNERINGHKFSNNTTALKKHSSNNGHNFNFDQVTILKKENNNKARNIMEMIQIKKHKHAINDKTDITNLSKIYYSIL
jgi:hypothetical protein